eukprot:gene15526-biopygen8173
MAQKWAREARPGKIFLGGGVATRRSIRARWRPIRVGYGTLVAPPESQNFRDFCGFFGPRQARSLPPRWSLGTAGSPPPGGSWERQFRPSARFRLRMDETKSAHKAVIRQLYCGPGLAGDTRMPKVTIWAPKKQYSGPLAPHQGRIWHPGGTTRKSKFPRFCRIFCPGQTPSLPPCPPPGRYYSGIRRVLR